MSPEVKSHKEQKKYFLPQIQFRANFFFQGRDDFFRVLYSHLAHEIKDQSYGLWGQLDKFAKLDKFSKPLDKTSNLAKLPEEVFYFVYSVAT